MVNYLEKIKCLYNYILSYTSYLNANDIAFIKDEMEEILKEHIQYNANTKEYSIYDIFNMKDKITKEIENHNNRYLNKLSGEIDNDIFIIENHCLNDNQKRTILKDEYNQLILSCAGTGKTTLLLAKLKYLLETNQITKDDFLCLSFTNKSANDLKNRLLEETNINDANVYTFHKYCLEIIKGVEQQVPNIYNNDLSVFVKDALRKLCGQENYFGKVMNYLFSMDNDIDESEFYSYEHYQEYLKYNPPITLKGERVKSYGEVEIANFLYEHGIEYIYENPYEYETNNKEYGQYCPDFYLPDYHIYIEYFGINKNGQVPNYFVSHHSENAVDEYRTGMQWKENLHLKNGTTLIMTYYYEKEEKQLISLLENKLKQHNVEMKAIDCGSLWDIYVKSKANVIDSFCRLIASAISLIKMHQYSKDYIEYLNNYKSNRTMEHNLIMLEIIWPIYEEYNHYLEENNYYDFNDLILKAIHYVHDNKYTHSYKYILVDEFQDISIMRLILLNELRLQNQYKLLCVGDDWQSIYNFNGSNVDILLNIEKYIGVCDIDANCNLTYRYNKCVGNISKCFIERNKTQLHKDVQTVKPYNDNSLQLLEEFTSVELKASLLEHLKNLPMNSKILLLGRYENDKEFLYDINGLELRFNNNDNRYDVSIEGREDLNIEFMTIHKAKGLECDYTFILNNRGDKLGFPSRIETDSFITLLKQNNDTFEYAEERRLMYVGLTRAKEVTYLLNLLDNESVFIEELKSIHHFSKK